MNVTRMLGLNLIGIAMVATAFAADDAVKKDSESLQGTWVVESIEMRGKPQPQPVIEALITHMTFEGDKVTFKTRSLAKTHSFSLSPSKNPKEMDIVMNSKSSKAIYHLQGDALKICQAIDQDAPRPTEFLTKGDGKALLIVLKRKKP